jgi:hypothetical protein
VGRFFGKPSASVNVLKALPPQLFLSESRLSFSAEKTTGARPRAPKAAALGRENAKPLR